MEYCKDVDKWKFICHSGEEILVSEKDIFNLNYQLKRSKKAGNIGLRHPFEPNENPIKFNNEKIYFDTDILFHNLKNCYRRATQASIKCDKELADKLLIKPSHLSRCKKTKTAPLKEIIFFCKHYKISLDDIFIDM